MWIFRLGNHCACVNWIALYLPVLSFFFLFFCQPYPGLWNCKSVFVNLKIPQYGGSWRRVHTFPMYPCKNWHKNWYFHFYKSCDHQIGQSGTSTGVDSNKINHAGAGDVITLRPHGKLKTYLQYQCL